MDQEKLLCWNVRGLNSRARRSVVRNVIITERMSLLCLQETKVHDFPVAWIYDVIGTDFDYVYLSAVNTLGGILIAWRYDVYQLAPQSGIGYLDWWLQSRLLLPAIIRRGFDSLVILVVWCIWKERNLRVFQGRSRSAAVLDANITEEADRWSLVGFSHLAALWAGAPA
jgi:exonuclease III